MSPEKQRIAIAEACGFHFIRGCFYTDPKVPIVARNVPDYPNDLNAMHEAEKALPIGRHGLYRDNLINVTIRDCQSTLNSWWNATAAQRAEAFLRTIGKWEDG